MDSAEIIGLIALGGAGATLGIVEVVKRALQLRPSIEPRVLPVLAILVGIGWNWLLLTYLQAADKRLATVVLFGVMSGLAASGLWSGGKATIVEPIKAAQAEAERATTPHG